MEWDLRWLVPWRLEMADEPVKQEVEVDSSGDAIEHCADCGAIVDGQGYSIDQRCCFYCKAD